MDRIKPKALIFGRSFGLYGHSLALHDLGFQICVPSQYRSTIFSREEYAPLQDRCIYLDDPLAAISEMSLICCARRPLDNEAIAYEVLRAGYQGDLILEKPMSASPDKADRLAAHLSGAQVKWDVPYLLLHLEWFHHIKLLASTKQTLSILWHHKGQFTSDHWKAHDEEGGGILAFYLIHIVALFEKLGLACHIDKSKQGTWTLKGEWLEVEFTLADKASFSIYKQDEKILSQESPFGAQPQKGMRDTRIPALKRFYQAFLERENQQEALQFHQHVHERWRHVAH